MNRSREWMRWVFSLSKNIYLRHLPQMKSWTLHGLQSPFYAVLTNDADSLSKSSVGHTYIYTVTQKNPPWGFLTFFPKRLGFSPNFTRLLCVPIHAILQNFIQLSADLTKLCHIKRDHPGHTICSKCPRSTETHGGFSWLTLYRWL